MLHRRTHDTKRAAEPAKERERLVQEEGREDGADDDGECAHWCHDDGFDECVRWGIAGLLVGPFGICAEDIPAKLHNSPAIITGGKLDQQKQRKEG